MNEKKQKKHQIPKPKNFLKKKFQFRLWQEYKLQENTNSLAKPANPTKLDGMGYQPAKSLTGKVIAALKRGVDRREPFMVSFSQGLWLSNHKIYPLSLIMVYFILAKEINRVKIGYCGEKKLCKRFYTLQSSSPVKLTLIGIIPEVIQVVEFYLHRKFHAHQKCGEWFELSDEIQNFLLKLKEEPYESSTIKIPKLKVITEEEFVRIKAEIPQKSDRINEFLKRLYKTPLQLEPIKTKAQFQALGIQLDDSNFSSDLGELLNGKSYEQ